MKVAILAVGSALLLCAAPAMAQTNMQHDGTSPGAADQGAGTKANARGSLRTQVRDMLEQQGYSDVRVMPVSFIVHAKDKDGNPVVMGISPDSITEIAEVGAAANDTAGASGAMAAAPGSAFVTVPESDELTSNLIGLDVYNGQNQNVGQIKDIAVNERGRAQAYILSVGGVLGVGTRYVAVKATDVKVSYNDSDKKWHATMNTTADQLKAAPEFKYSGRWNANKS